jgi:hypothetical protein
VSTSPSNTDFALSQQKCYFFTITRFIRRRNCILEPQHFSLFSTSGFATFRYREIATGAGAIREQLKDLDLRIIIENSLVEWKELEDEGYSGDEWEDRKG